MNVDPEKLSVIHYPDPRLREICRPITEFNDGLAALADRMFELMRADRGMGLAASQVGVLWRIFVMNATGEEKDNLVFVNPVLSQQDGLAEAEEGCLSLPGINVSVRRARRCRIDAQDLKGNPITFEDDDLLCRCWQHEVDHLNGVLLIDRMGPSDRIATRKTLKGLEEGYADILK